MAEVDKNLTAAEREGREIVDELIHLGYDKRRETLGDQFFDEIRSFYNFIPQIRTTNPSFRPKIRFPDLQMMVVQEAGDITDNQPIIYLQQDSVRKNEREKALLAQWAAGRYNMEALSAEIWALMTGTAFIQISYRPELYAGRGGVAWKAWNPENVIVDPWCSSMDDCEYMILRVRMTYDEIRRRFNKHGWKLKPEAGVTPNIANQMGFGGGQTGGGQFDSMQIPPGPMRSVRIPGAGKAAPLGNPIVDYVFLHDDSRIKVEPVKGAETPFPQPITVPKYPRGRLQVWGDKYLLYDGPNPYRKFPLVPVHAMPPLTGFWAPPPIRYVLPFQQLAETMTSQTVENAIRLNNQIMVIIKGSGLSRDKVRGLPGEILEAEATQGGQPVYYLSPQPMPEQMVRIPNEMIQRMMNLFGFSPERQGKVAAGNISSSLMDAAIEQSEKLLRLRGRYYADAIQSAAELTFGTMLDYLGDTSLPLVEPNGALIENVPWQGALPEEMEGWDVLVDPNSVLPVAANARKKMALLLRNLGSIDNDTLLKWLDAPDREDILKKVNQERMLQAAGVDQRKQMSPGKVR
jgi:hypothetical protein